MTQRRALVIGGGIAGPAAALFLARAGIEPVVFEAYPRKDDITGGFQIAPNGMRVLATLGLGARLTAAGAASSEMVFRNHRGRAIGRIHPHASAPALNLERGAVIGALRDELVRQQIAVHYERRLAELTVAGREILARFDDGTTEAGDFVIGADGVHSRVRGLTFPAAALPRDTDMLSIGGFCKLALDDREADRMTFLVGRMHQFGYARFGAGSAWWCHLHPESASERAALLAMPLSDLRDAMLARYRGWADPVERLMRATEGWVRVPIYDVPSLAAWHEDRVLLIGDAAHAMSPAGGQGASMALEDAVLIGKLLADASTPLDHAFARFEAARKPRVEPMIAQAYANDRRTLKRLGPVAAWTRDRVMMPVFSRFIERALTDVYAYDAAASA
ncbi:MAG TPA: NAD(P)/FAD-dependent oxidoreductase [Kofleriaceae bacterium]|jgi:2-polyprenyl-6-methoxyphenol hydroxylase-like FAD-dependent oxidoreductase